MTTPPHFGLICAGRPIQTDFIAVDSTKYTIEILNPDSVNHLVVLALTPFPPNYAATIHLQLPNQPNWRFLGALTNEKPSAIYKVSGVNSLPCALNAVLGISIEPLETVMQQVTSASATANPSTCQLVEPVKRTESSMVVQILKHLYNYVTSFAVTQPISVIQPVVNHDNSNSTEDMSYIPVKVFEQWYMQVQRKLELDPDFFV